MNILILGNQTDSTLEETKNYYENYAKFFEDASKDQNLQIRYALFSDILLKIGDNNATAYDFKNKSDLRDYDAVFIRGKFRNRLDFAYVISRYMLLHKKNVINDYSHYRTSSKLCQAFTFFELGLPTPYTICSSKDLLELHYDKLNLPFVCKEVYGAHGNNNHLITDIKQLHELLNKEDNATQLYVLQNFIPNSGDYRLLIAGRRHLIIKRTAPLGGYLNNTSQGGSAELLKNDELPIEIIKQAQRCMAYLHMAIAGVDIIKDKQSGQYYFLEVNSQPQLLTGAFITRKQQLIGEYLKDLVDDHTQKS